LAKRSMLIAAYS